MIHQKGSVKIGRMNFSRDPIWQFFQTALPLLALLSFSHANATSETLQETPPKTESSEQTCIAVVGTNDLHGAVEPQIIEVGNQKVERGGLLAVSGYINILRKQFGDKLILLDGGDLLHGTLTANVSKGGVMVKALNALGFTAAAIGNHEFDFGPLLPGDPDRLGVVKKRISEANFPFLAANISQRASKTPITWVNTMPSTMIDVSGIQVGIIGLATPSTPLTTRPQNVATLQFLNPQPILIREANRLRDNGAQLVILVSHMGDACPDTTDPKDLSSCDGRGELFSLLQSLPSGLVDVAVGGHTHAVVGHWIGSTATIEAAHRGRKFTWVKACLDSAGKLDRLKSKIAPAVDTCLTTWSDGSCTMRDEPTETKPAQYQGQVVSIDPAVQHAVQPFIDEVSLTRSALIGAELPKAFLRKATSGILLGDAVAEAIRRSVNADVGIQNRGGVRADLPAGATNYGEAYRVLPFGNQVTSMQLTGAQLYAMVLHIAKRQHGKPPHIAGLRVLMDETNRLSLLHPSGTPVEISRVYKVATNDFLATGGQGLATILANIPQASITIEPILLLDAFVNFLKQEFPMPIAELPAPPQAIPANQSIPTPVIAPETP